MIDGKPINRMEPPGPMRYLETESEIRNYMKKDRRIVSTILMDSVIKVLKTKHDFTDEQLEAFNDDLKKEIEIS